MSKELEQAVKTESVIYQELKGKWNKARIIFKGEDAVHEATTDLLPKLPQQTDDMYAAYVERARFLNAFKKTVSGLEGTVTRKEPIKDINSISEFENDIDTAGTTIDGYAKKLLHEMIKIGPCGSLVDYNRTESEEELTIAEAEEANARPKLCFYISDNIINHRYGVINGKKQLILVVLKETYNYKKNEFEIEEKEQYRVLRINDDGFYEQQLYRQTDQGIEPFEAIIPEMDGERFKSIPFEFHGKWEEPPLYDLVTNNIKHYQLKADHNHGLHYIGLPTAYRTGVDPNDNNLPTAIGAQAIWDIENENAKVGYLEFEGKGMDHVVDELETIKEDMAFLGASMLASDKMVNESATKANFRKASETSSLADIVIDASASYTKVLQMFSMWLNNSDDVSYEFNTDFDIEQLTADEIIKRVQSWQMGAFSKRSLYKQLKNGEVELEGETFEDEEELINKGE